MVKASSSWQQIKSEVSNWTQTKSKSSKTIKQSLKRFQEPGSALGFLTIVIAMLLWNWKLLLASSVGIGAMVSVYSMYKWDVRIRWYEINKFFNSPNSRFAVAVISGGIATLSTYTAAAVWVDSNSHWIAAGAILQGFGTLLTLALLVWQMVSFYKNQQENQLDELLVNLTEEDPLKRLIALRQINKLVSRKSIGDSAQNSVAEFLKLLLCREDEQAVRDAVFDTLQLLEEVLEVEQKPPSNTGVPLAPLPTRVKERVY